MKLFFIFLIVAVIHTKSVFSQDNGFGVLWAYNDWGDIIKGKKPLLFLFSLELTLFCFFGW